MFIDTKNLPENNQRMEKSKVKQNNSYSCILAVFVECSMYTFCLQDVSPYDVTRRAKANIRLWFRE